ncbi:helix-turn-helix domain-containing protein [Primorskyibacter sp. S87]|uniref:AraC family transcriptional regulator n=1 Tax=Primorskyibacter sp. S87 TaxID=3415126 RepID=UPI003C7D1CCC
MNSNLVTKLPRNKYIDKCTICIHLFDGLKPPDGLRSVIRDLVRGQKMNKTVKGTPNGSAVDSMPMRIRAGALAGPLQRFSVERCLRISPCLDMASEISMSEEYVDFGLYLETFEKMEKAAYDEAFLIRTGLGQSVGELGLFGKAVLTSETLWDSLQIVRKGLSYLTNAGDFSVSMRFGRCRIAYDLLTPPSLGSNLEIQYSVGLLANVVNQAKWMPTANMRIGYPGAKSNHKHFFPYANIVHHSPNGVIEFDDILLRSPLRTSDAGLYATLKPLVESKGAGLEETTEYKPLVQRLLTNSIEHTHAPLKLGQAAALLGLSSRTLQEKLNLEGARFSKLRSRARHKIAREALFEGYTIEDVAAKVGYSHRQTFSEAFTATEGVTPSVFVSSGRLN